MKFTNSISFLVALPAFSFAQTELALNKHAEAECEHYCVLDLLPEQEERSIVEPSNASFLFDAGILFLPVRDVCLPGIAFNIGGANDKFASGFSFNGVFSHTMQFPSSEKVISPYYQYLFFGWNNEYFLHPRNKIALALDLNMGWAYQSFADRSEAEETTYYQFDDSSSYYTEQSYYSSGLIVSDNMFVMEPGINFLYDLTCWMSMGAGAHSRIVLGINKESPLADTGFYSGNLFLRFRIFGRNAG
jgi:hypothetical protein